MKRLLLALLGLLWLSPAHATINGSCDYTQGTTTTQFGFTACAEELAELLRRAPKTATGVSGTNAISLTFTPAMASAPAAGDNIIFTAVATSTNTVTIITEGGAPKNAANEGGTNLGTGDVTNGQTYLATFDGTKWRVIVRGTGAGGGAAVGGDYLMLSNNGTNTAERLFTPGTGLGGTDGGANSTYTLNITDVELTSIAGLVSAADRLPYYTGSGTASLATFSAFARTYIDDATAAATWATLTGDELSQDAVGAAVTDGTFIDFTYNDGANTITATIIANTLTAAEIAPDAIASSELANLSVDTGAVIDDAVTYAKIQNVSATDRVLCRDTAAAGDIEECSLDASLAFTGGPGLGRAALTGDVTAAAGSNATTVAADAVALSTDTTGNYVGTVSAGTGIAVSGIDNENATKTVAFDYTNAGSDPALNADECRFTDDGSVQGFMVCEGDTANAFEQRLDTTDPTADRLFTLPDADSNPVRPLACTGTDKVSGIAATGIITCTADAGAGGGISNVVEDLTPQAGGNWDWNGKTASDALLTDTIVEDYNENAISWTNDAAGATGVQLEAHHDSATPADGDLALDIRVFAGTDDEEVGRINYELDDGSTGSEDGRFNILVDTAGVSAQQMVIGSGVIVGTSTTMPGAGAVRLTTVELGADTDTTLARNAAGVAQVEGVKLVRGDTGATDNAILRADGTGASLAQGSALIIADTSGAISGAASGFAIEFFGATGTDSTLTAPSAGDLNIEGNRLYRAGGTDVAVADGGTGASALTDLIALTTHTTGNYVKDVADGTGIDGTAAGEGATYTPTLDLTEVNSTTWGSGTFTTMTFDAGATDPVLTFGSATLLIEGVTSFRQADAANAGGSIKLLEDPGTGSNFIAFLAPASLTSDVTCTLENDANPIPDSCVGDGTDAGAAGGDSITVNGVAVIDGDFDDATPATASGGYNVKWQKDASSPANISAYVDFPGATDLTAVDVADTFLIDDVSATTVKEATVGEVFKGVNTFTEDTAPSQANDFTNTYDASGASAKKVRLSKIGVGKKPIALLAGAGTLPTAGTTACTVPAVQDSGSNDIMFKVCQFSASADNGLEWTIPAPKSSDETVDWTVRIDWTSTTTTDASDDVIWTASAVCFSNDDAINGNAFPAVDTVTDTQTAAGDFLSTSEITAVTPAGTWAENDMCVLRITRDADAAGDNFNGTADLINVMLYITSNANTDD